MGGRKTPPFSKIERMITNPKTFFEQFQNFIEESGLQLKKFKSNLSNYFTKSEAIDTFLGKTDQAESAKKADTATKATQDASGNVISSTYATKTEVTQGLAGKANASHTHTTAQVTGLDTALAGKAPKNHTHTIANVTGLQDSLNATIPKAGNRGALAGYSSSATGTMVNATSGDSLYASTNVTVTNGATGQTWTKVVKLSAGTVTLGTNWSWVGGEAPELKYPCLLVCHWNQDKGIAGIVAGVA